MAKIKELFEKYKEFILYVIVGCCTTMLNLGIYAVWVLIFGDSDLMVSVATVIAWIISVTFAFFMNKLVVFGSKGFSAATLFKEAVGFYGARVFSLFLELGGLWLLNTALGLRDFGFRFIIEIPGTWISKFIMLVIVTISNYIFSKFVVFKKRKINK